MAEMHNDSENPGKPEAAASDRPNAIRRRIATATLAAPVILSFSGRSALATWGHSDPGKNCSVSGWIELGTSIAPSGATARTSCGGQKPYYWKTKNFSGKGTWSNDKCRHEGGLRFTDCFFDAPPCHGGYPNMVDYRLGDVFTDICSYINNIPEWKKDRYRELYRSDWYKTYKHPPYAQLEFAQHALATFLNASYGYIDFDPIEVKKMYLATFAGGSYPVSGMNVLLSQTEVQQFWMSTYAGSQGSYAYAGAGV